jgi:hypothetical protein
MSNRFHNKLHRQNHHSNPTSGYPDSALDPIASFEQPFQGEFYSQGDIITTQNLSAELNLHASGNSTLLGTVKSPNIGTGEDNSVVILNSSGFLKTDEINPQVWDTTAKYVSASDGALTVNRLTKATDSIGINESIVFDNGTNVGIGTDNPGANLTVSGTLSTSGTATIGTIADSLTNTSVVVQTAGLLQKRTLNVAAFDTTSRFVSASDGDLTINRLTKATDSNGINESIVFDDGTNVGIGTDTPSAKLDVNGNAIVQTDLTVKGNFTVLGTTSQLDTLVYATSAVSITNAGTGPALTVTQTGSEPIAHFIDANGDDIIFDNNGYVGLGVASPSEKLDVSGNLKTTGTATIGTIADSLTNTSVVVQTAGLLQKRTLNVAAFDTTSRFVSASDGALTVNRLTKATDSNGINESIVFDDGTNVGISIDTPTEKLHVQGNIKITGTVEAINIGAGEDNSVVVLDSTGKLRTDEINPSVWDTTAKYVSASDGALTVNRLTKATDSNGINESIVTDDGTLVSVGGNLSTTGTATIGTIATGTADSVLIESSGLVQKRTIDSRAWGSSLVDGTGTANRVAYWTDSNTIAADDDFFFDGTNVGIGTTSPGVKLDVSGQVKAATTAAVVLNITGLGSGYADAVNGVATIYSENTSGPGGNVLKVGSAFSPNGLIVKDTGNVGIGTTSPGVKLDVAGTTAVDYLRVDAQDGGNEGGEIQLMGAGVNGGLQIDNHAGNLRVHTLGSSNYFQIIGGGSTTALRVENGSAYIGKIDAGTTNSVVIESSGTLQKRSIDSRAWGSSLVDGTGTTNYVAKWTDADTITNSQIFDNGTNVGIGTASPGVKLDVDGVIRSNNEIIGSALGGSGQARYISGNYGVIHRNDGSDYYILKTVSGDQYGGWDASRPFVVNLATGNVGIGSTADGSHKLSVTGNIKSTNVIIPGSSTVTPAATTALPSSNDVILNNQAGPVTITAFSDGVAGVTYTITNKSTHAVTLDTSASLFVRGGNSWASHKCTTNSEGYIVLPQNFSCSLRMDSTTSGSVW